MDNELPLARQQANWTHYWPGQKVDSHGGHCLGLHQKTTGAETAFCTTLGIGSRAAFWDIDKRPVYGIIQLALGDACKWQAVGIPGGSAPQESENADLALGVL